VLQQFLAHPSIRERSFAIDHPDCLLKENPDGRIGGGQKGGGDAPDFRYGFGGCVSTSLIAADVAAALR
jgi:hypothetical protein